MGTDTDATNTLLAAALEYAALGWRVVPLHNLKSDGTCTCKNGARCENPGKHPRPIGWQNEASNNAETVERWWRRWPLANVGVAMGQGSGLVDFECDSADEEQILIALFSGDFPVTACFSSSRGRHWLFQWRPDLPGEATYKIGKLVIRVGNRGAQSVFPPSLHPSGVRYAWKAHPNDVPIAAISDLTLARIWNWDGIENASTDATGSPEDVAQEALKWLPESYAVDYHQWLGVGMALKSIGDHMLPVWDGWSKSCAEKYEPNKCAAKWKTFDKPTKPGVRTLSLGSLVYWAKQAGWQWGGKPAETKVHGSIHEFAIREARRSSNINSPAEQGDLYAKLEWFNSQNAPQLPADDLRKAHSEAIAAVRKEQAIPNSARFAYTIHGLKYDRGMWLPGEWQLTVVLSDPVEYKLFVPRWQKLTGDGTGVIQMSVEEYRDANSVAALVQAATRVVVLDDTPGVWTAVWNGSKGNKKEGIPPRRGLKALLIDQAKTEMPPATRKRYVAVAEMFQDLLERARPAGEKDEPDPRRAVVRSDGTIWFRWRHLWREPIATREVRQPEVDELSRRLGLRKEDYQLWPTNGMKRKRYCVISQGVMETLRSIILEEEDTDGRANTNAI